LITKPAKRVNPNLTTSLQKIRQSCSALISSGIHVKVDAAATAKFASTLSVEEIRKSSENRRGFPLKFGSIRQEVNFLCTLNLLNFGSGYRVALHKACDRGSQETICFGVIGMHLSGEITARSIASLSLMEVANLFGVPVEEDYEVQPGIHSVRPTKLKPFVEKIRSVLHETGRILLNLRCEDFVDFIGAPPASGHFSAAFLVDRFVETFPALADVYKFPINGVEETIYMYKKAQLLVADLYHKLRTKDPRYALEDVHRFTVFADNVLPAVLRHFGALVATEELSSIIENNTAPSTRAAAELRAGAVVACDLIVKAVNASRGADVPPVQCQDLDYFLWEFGKKPEIRQLARHSSESIFY